MTVKRKVAYEQGLEAEKIAAQYFQFKGYKVIERRYKTPVGEVDFVVRKGNVLVFAEVKSYKNEEQALYAITSAARRRIEAAAMHFIAHNEEVTPCDMRFDVVVVPPGHGQAFRNLLGAFSVRHLDNAWLAGQ